MAERAIWRRDKSRPDLEVDTAKMLAAIVWLALLEIDLVERTQFCKADVQPFVQCTACSWVVDRVVSCLECSLQLKIITVAGEPVAAVAFLGALPATTSPRENIVRQSWLGCRFSRLILCLCCE
ncbi:hypothetical protein C476_17167 [Natrinema limicola JCM 13563]|uniref:Uncharacterized protein n=1 Tax=Natrinema limicola JCM 13563 TaxID=1230457 RepID=M0C238_9EURY|nr:hypothetical protein C476_17167 [Natrinema limicola JCM 13563]